EAQGRRGPGRIVLRAGHATAGGRSARSVSRPAGRRTRRSAAGPLPGRHRRGAASGGVLMQNINLYQIDAPQSAGPRPRQMLLGLAVLAGLLLMHGGWTAWHSHAGTQALAQAEQRSRQVEAELLARQANFQEPQLD